MSHWIPAIDAEPAQLGPTGNGTCEVGGYYVALFRCGRGGSWVTSIERIAPPPHLRARISCGATLDCAHRCAPFVPELPVIDPILPNLAA